GFFDRYLPLRFRNELRRRSFPDPVKPFTRTSGWREAGRLLFQQLGLQFLTRPEAAPFSVDAVYLSLDRHVARRLENSRQLRAVYAYDSGALESFRAARARQLKCIYEHPIVYWREARRYQQEEAELHPEWKPTLGAIQDSEEKLARKDSELALADVVIVPSTFSRNSLEQAPGFKAQVKVVPYGLPTVNQAPDENHAGKLRVLFVGALSQAKGLKYLLEAAAKLERKIELTLVGKRVSSIIPTQAVLGKHRWIHSLPYTELLREMSRHDVLVLPSLHEGFGLVLGEAMAQGLVVIATAHSAAPDLIDDGVDGFIIPIRSSDAIVEKLELLLREPARLREMKQAARRKAEIHSWETYRRALVRLAREVVF
ncbi:MAG TPA: glycosyltransferase family 4 protein, partial [Chthoniobacterales bacterium]|nr:glycosyltransferase family 4 protein [Chthoniobacterales bacterium]